MKIVLQIEMRRPYPRSVDVLLDMVVQWGCDIIKVSPSKPFQTISMPWKKFKSIWGFNPKQGYVAVPKGTEDFISSVVVKQICG